MENFGDYGQEAELAVFNYMQETLGLDTKHNEPVTGLPQLSRIPKSAAELISKRAIRGDIFIDIGQDVEFSMNVVRGTWVSHMAVERFKGQFYCMFPNGDISDPSKGRVILNSTLKSFWNTCKKNNRWTDYVAEKPGFRYSRLNAYITLEDFIVHMSKMVIMNIPFGTQEFWRTLKEPFVKDYRKKMAQEAKA